MVNVLDPQEGETICDPCCGSGGFLIKTFEYIRSKIEKEIQKEKEVIRNSFFSNEYDKLSDKRQSSIEEKVNKLLNELNQELELKNELSRLRRLSFECIFGSDANPRMARTAKMNMIMHGDGHGGVHHHDGLLNVNGIYDGKFDVILTNPPFGARVEKSLRVTTSDLPSTDKIEKYKNKYPNYEEAVLAPLRGWASENNNEGKPILEIFDLGSMSGLTEVLFIERSLRLLKPGGRMGIVLPEGVLNNPMLQKVRDYVESKALIINITSIPQDVFIASGATVKPSLLFLRKFTEGEARHYEIERQKIATNTQLKYQDRIDNILEKFEELKAINKMSKTKIDLKQAQKEKRDGLREIEVIIEDEIKKAIKKKFNYRIPIIEVEKAGISSTGAKIENELEPIAEEFAKYRKKEKFWNNKQESISYQMDAAGNLGRRFGKGEPHKFYI